MRSHSAWFPDGSRLYLEVNVTEAGTGEKRQAVAMDTFFANPYYKIGFSGSKKYFKPGFPYTLGVSIYVLPKIDSVPAAFLAVFSESKKYFKPGFHYTLGVSV